MRLALALIVVLILLTGCPTPVCVPTETRCQDQSAEICGSDGQWRTLMDCGPEAMTCCFLEADDEVGIPEGYSCMTACPTTTSGPESN